MTEKDCGSLGVLHGLVRKTLFAMYLLFLALPLIALAGVAFAAEAQIVFPPSHVSLRWFQGVFANSEWRSAFAVSAQVGVTSALIDVATAAPLAWWLWRRRFRGFAFAMVFVGAPLIVPVVAYGFGVYTAWLKLGWTDTVSGIALAHACLGFPAVLLTLCAGLSRLDPQLEEVAWSLGASPLKAALGITLPRMLPSLFAAGALGFLLSLDESVVVQFLSGPQVLTVPRLLWQGIRFDLDPSIAAVALLWMGATVLLTVLSTVVLQHANAPAGKQANPVR